MKLTVENIGPLRGHFELSFDSPITVLTGDSGTGKSFLLRILQLFIFYLAEMGESLEVNRLEDKLSEEFNSVISIINTKEEKGRIALEYDEDVIADVELYKKFLGEKTIRQASRGRHIIVGKWKGGAPTYRELAKNSIIAPDTRVAIAKIMMTKGYSPGLTPSEEVYAGRLRSLREKNDWSLNESLNVLKIENILPKIGGSYFDRGIIEGLDSRTQSAAVFSLLSLAPAIRTLYEGRAFLVAVDTIESHLTPLLQGAVAVNLARWAKKGWVSSEEYPAPLLLVTHSSIVLAALQKEIEEGVKDRTVYVDEKVTKEDVRMITLYREDGEVKWKISEGIELPTYLREYIRLI
jgi:hypothetical protein